MFTFAVPDLHGRYDLFKEAITRIDRYGSGKTVFLGDYIDRGPQSKEIVEALMKGREDWVAIKGNHEDMMYGACNGLYDIHFWTMNGGDATINSFGGKPSDEVLEWADKLPLYHTDKHRLFVHAGVMSGADLRHQTSNTFLWLRPSVKDYHHVSGLYVVHGHTPLRDGPLIGEGCANFDCGAVFTNRLVIGVFDDNVPGKPVDTIEIKSFLKG